MAVNLGHPLLRHLALGAAMLTRGMTLGVRGIAIDEANRVCLVRHTYLRGWHLPGGGIEPGQTATAAMVREFLEEAEIAVEPAALQLHGFFLNRAARGRDHIAVYVARAFTVARPKAPDREIAEAGFFPLDALPEGTTRATHARLLEIRQDGPRTAPAPSCGSAAETTVGAWPRDRSNAALATPHRMVFRERRPAPPGLEAPAVGRQ